MSNYGPKVGSTGRMITLWGETKNLVAWSKDERCHVSSPTLTERLNNGWDPEQAISSPPTKDNNAERRRVKVGDKFNRLTLAEQWEEQRGNQKKMVGRFDCECGGSVTAIVTVVKNGKTKSCGCLVKDMDRSKSIERSTTHGMTHHPLYLVYHGMLNRCYNPKIKEYKNCGGRGITVCDSWRSDFANFAPWALSTGWEKGLSMDRIDRNGPFSPDNCRWITRSERSLRRSNNKMLTAFGEEKTLKEWSDDQRAGAPYSVIAERINKLKWDTERAITTPGLQLVPIEEKLKGVEVGAIPVNCRHPLHAYYDSMKARCYYSTDPSTVKNYQDRGITVCDEWLDDYRSFIYWSLANGWVPGLTLDRIDNDKGYSPGNCRWTTDGVQANNKTDNRFVTAFGETKTVTQWVADPRARVSRSLILSRINNNWTAERAISTEVYGEKRKGPT